MTRCRKSLNSTSGHLQNHILQVTDFHKFLGNIDEGSVYATVTQLILGIGIMLK